MIYQNKTNIKKNYYKNNKGFLPTPVDILSIVLLGLALVVSYFYFTSNFTIYQDSFNLELNEAEKIKSSSIIIPLAYDTKFENQVSNRAIQDQCKGLIIQDIREVYFLEKHCRNSNNLYALVQNDIQSHLRGEFQRDAYLQRYMLTIKNRIGQCYEFSTVSNDRQIQGYLEMGSSIIPIPRSSSILRDGITYLTLCTPTLEGQPGGLGIMP